jgi:hypothetical protein
LEGFRWQGSEVVTGDLLCLGPLPVHVDRTPAHPAYSTAQEQISNGGGRHHSKGYRGKWSGGQAIRAKDIEHNP